MSVLPTDRDDDPGAPSSSSKTKIVKKAVAPEVAGQAVLGLTIPDLLADICKRKPNPAAYNQLDPSAGGWRAWSHQEFQAESEQIAAGLRASGLASGERVGLYMHSDAHFCLADMGCLIAGLVDVPLYLAYTEELSVYVLDHSEARALIVSDINLLRDMVPVLKRAKGVEKVIVARPPADVKPEELNLKLPESVEVRWLEGIREDGAKAIEADPELPRKMKEELKAQNLATILYTSGTTGTPKGVMLSHQNITSNVTGSFNALAGDDFGSLKRALSFLPLTHVFARTLQYGYMYSGTAVFFTDPNKLAIHLREVKPTALVAVPRVLEKLFERILAKGAELKGTKKFLFNWALDLAKNYKIGQASGGWTKAQLQAADMLVLRKWREAVGGELELLISGGAPLRAELANVFTAAGFTVLEGYGLTETSPIISASLPNYCRAGAVGVPLGGTEVAIAEDGEVLCRGPLVMMGYYKNEEATKEAIDEDGWFHTGDIGDLSDDHFLTITDRKKSLFKLSTGKYVTPQPLENALGDFPLIETSMIVGAGRKFCAALIFVNPDALRNYAKEEGGLDPALPPEELVRDPLIQAAFLAAVHSAGEGMPKWSTIKRFALVFGELTVENKMLTPTLKMRRAVVAKNYADEIEAIYADAIKPAEKEGDVVVVNCEDPSSSSGVLNEIDLGSDKKKKKAADAKAPAPKAESLKDEADEPDSGAEPEAEPEPEAEAEPEPRPEPDADADTEAEPEKAADAKA